MNSADSDQTAPLGVVWSWSKLLKHSTCMDIKVKNKNWQGLDQTEQMPMLIWTFKYPCPLFTWYSSTKIQKALAISLIPSAPCGQNSLFSTVTPFWSPQHQWGYWIFFLFWRQISCSRLDSYFFFFFFLKQTVFHVFSFLVENKGCGIYWNCLVFWRS